MASQVRRRTLHKENASSKKAKINDSRNGVDKGGTNDGFVDGAIFRVRMKNFLTYDECEFKPGPHLNVLLGPNGTGKSTVVCAICLGLAGGTKLLGRANECGEFVKHGCSSATIEVELFNSDGNNYVITRDIQRVNNSSVWKINYRPATQKEVQELTKSLNVQISNLCQFLPQDRVVEFAKMSQQQLLEATQKAVGPPGMYDDHQSLIALGKSEKELELNLKEKQEHLEKLKQTNERLEHEVKRYFEREKHLEKVQMLEKKRPWVEYEDARKEFIKMKKEKEEVKKKLEEARRQNAPMQQRLQQAEQKVRELDEKTKELTDKGTTAARKAKDKNDSLEKLVDKIDEFNSELKDIEDEEKKRLKKISELERQINGFKNELEQLPNPEELQPKIEELNQKGRQIGRQVTELQQQGTRLQDDSRSLNGNIKAVSGRIKELEDMNNQRMKYLRERYRDTFNAVMWLRNNKDKFKDTIHEPILLQINVNGTAFAKYIETMISRDDLTAFVCENREDLKLFLSETKDKQHLRVSAVAPPDAPLSSFKPRHPLKELNKWHFEAYLKDLFTAPDAVMRYLCETYRAHDIPLGTDWTAANADRVIEESGINVFYTPSSKYSVKRSLYGNRERSTMVSHIREAQIFSISVDVEAKKQLEFELQGLQSQLQAVGREYSEIQDNERQLSKQQEDLRNEKKKLQSHSQRRRTLSNQLQAKGRALEETQNQAPNQKAQEERIQQKINQTNSQRVQAAIQFKNLVKECLKITKERFLLSLYHTQVVIEKQKVEAAFRDSSQLLRTLEAETNRATEAFNNQKRKAKELRRFAQQKTDTPEGEDIAPDLRESFAFYPNTLEEIDEMIHDERARAECSYPTDPGVIREYNRRKKEINHLSNEISSKEKDLNDQKQEIENLKQRWLTPLLELTGQISEKYSMFFRRMGCAGEVTLSKDQGESDYEKYGVQIKVKFRAKDELHVLTPFHQSGGERSVATMLYLMAIQELTKCPFRVVDEINQGMDPNNERKVFELVVQTACRPNTAQYFLITPKLLPDLKFTDKVKVLCVFNGHWMLDHSEWNLERFINKRKSMRLR